MIRIRGLKPFDFLIITLVAVRQLGFEEIELPLLFIIRNYADYEIARRLPKRLPKLP